ncbi:hypothetical protein ACJ72_08277 [Emergomyces africanus]|uniref:Uncharacterized protein n=1 Tax=Emergomyces africanus TaxID=1955775 RepID=A0A1B7NKW6_9EURO|nr:hypothetical protein ACJ72_08277 [Emergomyces africanus]
MKCLSLLAVALLSLTVSSEEHHWEELALEPPLNWIPSSELRAYALEEISMADIVTDKDTFWSSLTTQCEEFKEGLCQSVMIYHMAFDEGNSFWQGFLFKNTIRPSDLMRGTPDITNSTAANWMVWDN